MKLHYSQTLVLWPMLLLCFSTLWNYTTLKPQLVNNTNTISFSTLWNYTTLKPDALVIIDEISFSTLWNYTTLKPYALNIDNNRRFSTLWNYTTLKPTWGGVVVPPQFQYLMKLHYSQTCVLYRMRRATFQYLMKLHYSQTSNKLRHYNAQGNNTRYIYYTI